MLRCKIDDGMLEALGVEGYVERWKCRKCRVVWEMKPQGDTDTDREVLLGLLKQKKAEYDRLVEDRKAILIQGV